MIVKAANDISSGDECVIGQGERGTVKWGEAVFICSLSACDLQSIVDCSCECSCKLRIAIAVGNASRSCDTGPGS